MLAMNTPKHQGPEDGLPEELKEYADWFVIDVDTRVKPVNAFFNLFSSAAYNLERFYSREFRSGLQQIIQEREFDLIQLEGLYLAPYFRAIRAVTDAPIVMRSHNVEFEIWERLAAGESNVLKRRYFQLLASRMRKFETLVLDSFAAIVPISPKDQDRFRELGATIPMHTCPIGVNAPSYQVVDALNRMDAIGFLGALDWMPNREGIDWFLEKAWPRIRREFPKLRFRLAGRNMPLDWDPGRHEGVEVLGEVDDAKQFLSEQRLAIVPLLSGSGMRFKIIESLALERAVVATSVAAEGIQCKSGQHLMIADDPAQFANSIIELLRNAGRAADLGKQGAALVRQHYDADQLVFDLLGFYNKTLSA